MNHEVEAYEGELRELRRRVQVAEYRLRRIIGWREHDWPEGFDRRTAELVAELATPESVPSV